MINLIRIASTNHPLLEELIELYQEVFPQTERREISDLKILLYNQRMSFNALIYNREVVGMLVYWEFDSFLFVEHFALFPKFRGLGIGTSILTLLKGLSSWILLEIEHPITEIQKRRHQFYMRNGFIGLDIHYFQPPYVAGGSAIPMLLMSNHYWSDCQMLANCVLQIHKMVYNKGFV